MKNHQARNESRVLKALPIGLRHLPSTLVRIRGRWDPDWNGRKMAEEEIQSVVCPIVNFRALDIDGNQMTLRCRWSDRVWIIPIFGFPRLSGATLPQLLRFYVTAEGIHWPELDEDIKLEQYLARPENA